MISLLTLVVLSHGWLGVEIQNQASDAGRRSVVIVRVEPGSPAEAGGLLAGDVVATVDATPISLSAELVSRVVSAPPGSSLRLGVVRSPSTEMVTRMVTVGNRPPLDPLALLPMPPPPRASELYKLRIYVAPHAKASETENRYRNVDMASKEQTVSRLLQEGLLRERMQVVTESKRADLILTPTTEAEISSTNRLVVDGVIRLRIEGQGRLLATVAKKYQLDFGRSPTEILRRQNQVNVDALLDSTLTSDAVERYARELRP